MQKHWDNPTEYPTPIGASVPAKFAIGNIRIAPATVLAPMVGVTDTVFRRFIRNASLFTAASVTENVEQSITNQQSGCGVIITAFTTSDDLFRMLQDTSKRRHPYYDDEHPISAQLFGS